MVADASDVFEAAKKAVKEQGSWTPQVESFFKEIQQQLDVLLGLVDKYLGTLPPAKHKVPPNAQWKFLLVELGGAGYGIRERGRSFEDLWEEDSRVAWKAGSALMGTLQKVEKLLQ